MTKGQHITQMKLVTDIRLWQLLLQGMKKQHKMTRVEALYDLIHRPADRH